MNSYVANLDNELTPSGDAGEEIAVGNSVTNIAAATLPERVSHVWLSVKTNAILVTFDGTDPASAGAGIHLPADGRPYFLSKGAAAALKMIEAAGGSAGVVRVEPMAIGG